MRTIQCRRGHLLRATARAEARTSGFAASATSSRRSSGRRRRDDRPLDLLDCGCGTGRQPRAARPLRTRLRLRPDRGRPAHRTRGRPDAPGARQRGRRPVSGERLRRRHLVRRALRAATSRRSGRRSPKCTASRAPAASSSSTSRRWTSLRGDHSVLSREVRRYSRARLADAARRTPASPIVRITYTNAVAVPADARRASRFSAGAGSADGATPAGDSASRRRRSTRC